MATDPSPDSGTDRHPDVVRPEPISYSEVVRVGASWDLMAGPRHLASAAERLEDATYVELRGSHFIPMEQPDRVHELLLDVLRRVG